MQPLRTNNFASDGKAGYVYVWDMDKSLDKQAIGNRLRNIRTALGLKQSDLSEMAGLAASTSVSYVESGDRMPSWSILAVLWAKYQISADYVLFGNPNHLSVEMFRRLEGGEEDPSHID